MTGQLMAPWKASGPPDEGLVRIRSVGAPINIVVYREDFIKAQPQDGRCEISLLAS